MTDDRSSIFIDAAVNDDQVRSYYELPDYLTEHIRSVVGGGTNDTLTFDQALLAFMDDLARDVERLKQVGAEWETLRRELDEL